MPQEYKNNSLCSVLAGKEWAVLKKHFLDVQGKYENKIMELSIIKEMGEQLRSIDFNDRSSLFWQHIRIIKKYKPLTGIWLFLYDEKMDALELVADSDEDGPLAHPVRLYPTDRRLERILRGKRPAVILDLEEEPFYNGKRIIQDGKMCCVPISNNKEGMGVLCLHTDDLNGFDNNTEHFFSLVSDQIATAVMLYRLYNDMLEESNRRFVLSRFFSKAITENILGKKMLPRLGGERRNVTIIFADLCGFTSMSEKLDQEEVLNILNRYFSFSIPIIFEFDGTLDKLMGDGIMAFFGAPIYHDDDPVRALKAAVKLVSTLKKKRMLIPGTNDTLKVSIGINTGEVIAGFLGTEDHLNYTVIGDAVNIAQRLQSLAGKNEILISQSVYESIKDMERKMEGIRGITYLAGQKVKGREQEVDTYRVDLV